MVPFACEYHKRLIERCENELNYCINKPTPKWYPLLANGGNLCLRIFNVLKRKQEKEQNGELFFEIRIGIHRGPVVEGIVGLKKFAYDIWGNTVNVASRMESSGAPGKVNISHSTFEIVKDTFDCIHRGKINAKNKGEIDMYFVEELPE
jgi:class 3 adenylate cyclase